MFKSQVHNTLGIYLSFEKPSCFLEEWIRKVSTGVAVTLNWGREQELLLLRKGGANKCLQKERLEGKSWSARSQGGRPEVMLGKQVRCIAAYPRRTHSRYTWWKFGWYKFRNGKKRTSLNLHFQQITVGSCRRQTCWKITQVIGKTNFYHVFDKCYNSGIISSRVIFLFFFEILYMHTMYFYHHTRTHSFL